MIDYLQFCVAASNNDSLVDDNNGVADVCTQLGIQADALMKAAEQRALRGILYKRGEKVKNGSVQLSPFEAELMLLLQTAWIDGAITGVRAVHNKKTKI